MTFLFRTYSSSHSPHALRATRFHGQPPLSPAPVHTQQAPALLHAPPPACQPVSLPASPTPLRSCAQVGSLVSGTVRRIEPFGVFVGINGTRVSGLLHISNVSRQHVETVQVRGRQGERGQGTECRQAS